MRCNHILRIIESKDKSIDVDYSQITYYLETNIAFNVSN